MHREGALIIFDIVGTDEQPFRDWVADPVNANGYIAHGMRNELYLRSRTGVRASFIALTLAEVSESLSSRQTEGKLS